MIAVVVLLAACSSSSSGPEPEAATTTTTTTTTTAPVVGTGEPEVVHGEIETADGRVRTYRVYVPSERAADAPLVIGLHGGTGNGDQFAASSGFDALAEEHGFVIAYPDGTPTALGERRLVWNGGGCCAAAVRDDVDDVGFLTELIDVLAAEHDLDPTRALVTGHSNGAIMGLRLACEAAEHIAAVAVQAGTVFVDDCAPSEPVAVMDLHGTEDRNLPIEGGIGPESTAGVAFPPVDESLEPLREAGGDVELVPVEGADHAWMPDASERLWAFLSENR
jgi:polyhydroxybutyrate depolymerase